MSSIGTQPSGLYREVVSLWRLKSIIQALLRHIPSGLYREVVSLWRLKSIMQALLRHIPSGLYRELVSVFVWSLRQLGFAVLANLSRRLQLLLHSHTLRLTAASISTESMNLILRECLPAERLNEKYSNDG